MKPEIVALFFLLIFNLEVAVSSSCNDINSHLYVKIVANYSPPISFKFVPPKYLAGSSLSLICSVEGLDYEDYRLFYLWSSNCSRHCREEIANTKVMHFPYLRSIDTGIYTCTVYNTSSCSGHASINVDVVGASIHMSSPVPHALPNNGIIIGYPSFIGVSSTLKSDEGVVINRYNHVLYGFSSLFYIRRDQRQPGILHVNAVRTMQYGDRGIYTYRTQDKFGELQNINVGIYPYSSSSWLPIVHCSKFSLKNSSSSLTCWSYQSPPTEVVWERNGVALNLDGSIYKDSKIINSRRYSVYMIILHINGPLDNAEGTFACIVSNQLGKSRSTKSNEAVKIFGPSDPLVEGLTADFNCSTFLEATRITLVIRKYGNVEKELISSKYQDKRILEYSFTPNSTALNGAQLICIVTTAKATYESTFILNIKELDHVVTVPTTSTYPVGSSIRIPCTAICYITLFLYWTHPNGSVVSSNGNSVKTGNQSTIGNETKLYLELNTMKASHGGNYSCISTTLYPYSARNITASIIVKLVVDSVDIHHSPRDQQFIGRNHTLVCNTNLSEVIDIPVQVVHIWTNPWSERVFYNDRRLLSEVSESQGTFESTLTLNTTQPMDGGIFTCSAIVKARLSDFVIESLRKNASVSINPAFEVEIIISYLDPDMKYFPPDYRIASSVNYTCAVVGVEDIDVKYIWNSTCDYCFAQSEYNASIAKDILELEDGGIHTCIVGSWYKGRYITGSTNTTMNIRGSGIYLDFYGEDAELWKKGSHPNNSYIVVPTSAMFTIYFCSVSRTVNIKSPNLRIIPWYYIYSFMGFLFRGDSTCFKINSYYSNSLFQPGIFSSYFRSRILNIGIYRSGFNESLFVSEVQRLSSRYSIAALEILCVTGGTPPTYFRWYKDGIPLISDEDKITITATVTNRTMSTYDILLVLEDIPDNIVGIYEIEVGSDMQNANHKIAAAVKGIQLICNSTRYIAGQSIQCNCSSDLEPTSFEWYKGNQSICSENVTKHEHFLLDIFEGSSSAVISVNTNDYGIVYKCVSNTPYGSQEKSFRIGHIEVPSQFGTIRIDKQQGEVIYGSTSTLSCIVTLFPGIFQSHIILQPSQWQQNSRIIVDQEINNEGELKLCGTSYKSVSLHGSLQLNPVNEEDSRTYYCSAIFWARIGRVWQYSIISAYARLIVISQAKFQLKIFPVMHCSTLDIDKAKELEVSIKENIETAVSSRCNCSFSASAIYSGQFICPQSTCQFNGCNLSTFASGNVIYRATVNGTSELLSATQILNYVDEWRNTSGTMLHADIFRLRLANECNLEINSYDDVEC